ncbi:MAG: glycosyltransferase family 1 protein [Hyphomonas sp.]|nr:glycosyltransferase family 4 protein [Hyphomonas sp.]MCA8904198.1 glycosyltransferase family 4 protein [Hyphomonas sp.]MCB9960539.1 glycosyltransferase family 4 protein [Hyphomonas sp.]MCB9972788.1 glycosyltransferase family 4 protein [Hyphomonas sp.]
MSFVINGRFLTRPMTGVDRVAMNLLTSLDRIWPVASLGRFTVAVPPGYDGRLTLEHGDVEPCGRLSGALWEQVDLPRHHRGATIFNPCNTAPLLHTDNIVVIHDANVLDYPDSYSAPFRAWYGFLLPRLARRASMVVTVSQHSAERLMAQGITDTPAHVVPNGCDHFRPGAAEDSPRRRMFLFAGSPAAHKNAVLFAKLAERFAGRDVEFVVAGSRDARAFGGAADTAPASGNLTFLGRIEDDALARLYREAAALVFPSYVEGFGFTPLEAQGFGCPVISSDRAPMTETLGDSALFADPDDLNAWEVAAQRILEEPGLAARLSEAGRRNARRYTWADAADAYLGLILQVTGPEALPAAQPAA